MTILITGATGTIGSQVLKILSNKGLEVRALTRDASKAKFPEGVVAVTGNMLDVAAIKVALTGVKTLFLLNTVSADELTQALLTLNLAKEAGVKNIVYFSVFNTDRYLDVPHFASKFVIEKMLEQIGIPVTVLRANCFMQNDATYFKNAVLGGSVYPFPIGNIGVSMVDARDISELVSLFIIQRESSEIALPSETINMVGPHVLTGESIAQIWSKVTGKTVKFVGDSTSNFEQAISTHSPSWMAMDLRLMLDRFNSDGMVASEIDVAQMQSLLGRAPRSYEAFAVETLVDWQK